MLKLVLNHSTNLCGRVSAFVCNKKNRLLFTCIHVFYVLIQIRFQCIGQDLCDLVLYDFHESWLTPRLIQDVSRPQRLLTFGLFHTTQTWKLTTKTANKTTYADHTTVLSNQQHWQKGDEIYTTNINSLILQTNIRATHVFLMIVVQLSTVFLIQNR